jgi:hypothetical protein
MEEKQPLGIFVSPFVFIRYYLSRNKCRVFFVLVFVRSVLLGFIAFILFIGCGRP